MQKTLKRIHQLLFDTNYFSMEDRGFKIKPGQRKKKQFPKILFLNITISDLNKLSFLEQKKTYRK